MENNIKDILDNLRSEFIIIGLTGAIGSGCTEASKFLSSSENDEKNIKNILKCFNKNELDLEYRRIQRIQYFYKEKKWQNFFNIRVSDILFLIVIDEIDNIKNKFIEGLFIKDIDEDSFNKIKKKANSFTKAIKKYDKKREFKIKEILNFTEKWISENVDKSSNIYTKLFQQIGQNIRLSGKIDKNFSSLNEKLLKSSIENIYVFIIPEIIRRTIKLIRKENNSSEKDFFVIDALRNSYEIEYFRNRYQSFYLFSIMASEESRENRILNLFKFNKEELEKVKKFEKNDDGIDSQAINTCIGKGDIFINNDIDDSSRNRLKVQLLKYIALIRKPALFTPSDDERYMQVAFAARYNSGCISRQVGASVIGEDGYIRGFGWNDVPENHIPCLYRTPEQLLSNSNNIVFSKYERSEVFYKHMEFKYKSFSKKFLPYCFKDNQMDIEISTNVNTIHNKTKFDKTTIESILNNSKLKNPTRERALHAEENAFLQVSKSGGQTVIGGTLYTTDSPCQLCAKKTMQLKIKRIVYIDAYPDISVNHTLKASEEKYWPLFEMFNGVVGSAYFKLFMPIIGIKDEIKLLK